MSEAELPRIAEKAALRIWLPRTITSPARKTLMALPFSPLPPARAAVSSMRLSAIKRAVMALVALPDADAAIAGLREWCWRR